MKKKSTKSTKAAPRTQRVVAAKKAAKAERGATKKQWKKRAWTKRAVRVPEAVMANEAIESIVREYRRWLWKTYRQRDRSLEDVAAEIGATRQGFTQLLRCAKGRFFFDTFLRTTFVLREVETGFTIAVEGWKYQLRWTVERCNCGCVSSLNGRA